ncbi:MAG: ABC transporter, partial [Pigmentiphaga sp.]
YQAWVTQQAAQARQLQAADSPATDSTLDRKQQRRQEAEARQRLAQQRKPLEKKLHKLEQELSALSARKAELDVEIADETLYLDARKDECRQILAEHGELCKTLNTVEEAWLELQAELEAIQ